MSGSAPTLMRKDLAGTRFPGKPRRGGHKRVSAARLRRSITDCPTEVNEYGKQRLAP